MKLKKICKGIAFFLVLLLALGLVQEILTPEFNSDGMTQQVISGMYALEKDSLDAIFLGTSHMSRGMSPMALYESTGIRSYNLATSGQPIQGSYILLKEALRNQNPSYVILDLSRMFCHNTEDYNSYFRYILDNMRWGLNKLELIQIYQDIEGNDGADTAVFPVIKFHTRWKNLTEADFDIEIFPQVYETMGQVCYPRVVAGKSLDVVEKKWADHVSTLTDPAEETNTTAPGLEVDPVFIEYFEKIKTLCEENDITLLTTKIPVHVAGLDTCWNTAKTRLAQRFCGEYGVDYIELMYSDVIDPVCDFHDSGSHLNPAGAEKIANAFGQYLQPKIDVSAGGSSKQFDESLEQYRALRSMLNISVAADLNTYLQALVDNKYRLSIYISSCEGVSGLDNARTVALLQQLGLEKLLQAQPGDNYVAVICDGQVLCEQLGQSASHKLTVGSRKVSLSASGKSSSIKIGGEEYSLSIPGLNFMVWDNGNDEAVNNTCFHTAVEGAPRSFNALSSSKCVDYPYYFED